MDDKLSINAKRLLIIHNACGVLRILISTFLSIFLLKQVGFTSVVIFNIILYGILPMMFGIFAHYIPNKYLLTLYRIGILIQFLFLIFMILWQGKIQSYIVLISIVYGVGSGFYWYAYNLLSYHFSKLDSRIRYIGYSNALSQLVSIIVPITLGTLISGGSYGIVFMIVACLMGLLVLYSLKLELVIPEDKTFELFRYMHKIANQKEIKSLYYIPIIEGITTTALTDAVVPVIIYLSFQSEFSLGVLSSIFALISVVISYFIGKKIIGSQIMKATSIAIIGTFLSSLLYLFPLSKLIIVLNKIIDHIFAPIRDFGSGHYAYNIIDIEHLENYNKEHFVLRETCKDIGRIIAFIIVFIVVSMFGANLGVYRILVLCLTIPSLFIIFYIRRIEKRVVKLLEEES